MSTIYQITISQLSAYLNIPGARDTVQRAIVNLQVQEAEELELGIIIIWKKFSFACRPVRVLI